MDVAAGDVVRRRGPRLDREAEAAPLRGDRGRAGGPGPGRGRAGRQRQPTSCASATTGSAPRSAAGSPPRGRGLATAAARLLCGGGFVEVGLERFVLLVGPVDAASIPVAERAGGRDRGAGAQPAR